MRGSETRMNKIKEIGVEQSSEVSSKVSFAWMGSVVGAVSIQTGDVQYGATANL